MKSIWQRYANPWDRRSPTPEVGKRPSTTSYKRLKTATPDRRPPSASKRPSGYPGQMVMRRPNDVLPGGLGDDRPDSDFDPKQLKMGIKVELEHTGDRALAKEIAKDHLTEMPDYYTRLAKMEHEA